uniref:Nucleotide pyrophosphohydrolase n=1 Tax=candidate division WOR-3 bacterium TaxID=2052148 RepID=A0A7C6EBL3_UNCW3
MTIQEFQKLIEQIYYAKDKKRGITGTYCWFIEEVGELARALRQNNRKDLAAEFADVFAWLVTLASLCEIDLETATKKYQNGCPKCHKSPCVCEENL